MRCCLIEPFSTPPVAHAGDSKNPACAPILWAKWVVGKSSITVNFYKEDGALQSLFFTHDGTTNPIWIRNPTMEDAHEVWKGLMENKLWDDLAATPEGWATERGFPSSPPPSADAVALLRRAVTMVQNMGLQPDNVEPDILGGATALYTMPGFEVSIATRNDGDSLLLVGAVGPNLEKAVLRVFGPEDAIALATMLQTWVVAHP
jgi:hypothetical protein